MRQLLQLHPHKHTGKVLHHKHTSYHALFLILGLAGIFMVLLGNAAKAADYQVTATVPATIPPDTPVITAPADGTQVSNPGVTISGTCPVANPAVIMTIHDETGLLGSGQCSGGGTFNVPVSLSAGTHHITATVTTITGGTGQTSSPVAVTYLLPIVPTAPVGTSTTPRTTAPRPTNTNTPEPLRITSDTDFIIFGYNDDAVWRGSFSGGTTPYSVTIDWGDGSDESFVNRTAGNQTFSHHYTALKSYKVSLLLSDAAGQKTTFNIAAISPATFNRPPISIGLTTGSNAPLWRLLYTLYLVQLLLTVLLWEYEKFDRFLFVPVRRRSQKRK